MAAIVWVSSRSSITIGQRNVMPKGPTGNLLHIAAFAGLGYFLARAFDAAGAPTGLGCATGRAALAFAALFGLSDEVHQFFTAGRQCSLYDALLDAGAAAFALLVPRLGGRGRPASWVPAGILLAALVALALGTGVWRAPGDSAIEDALLWLGFPAG